MGRWAEAFTGFSNVTLMQSTVKLDPTGGLTVTDQTRQLVVRRRMSSMPA